MKIAKLEVSVILAVYNENRYLETCLDSLANQRGVNYEVIVVDDGSHKRVVNNQLTVKSNFIIFRIKHSGTAKARNFGARKAKGKILVFIDGDMKFTPDFLERLTGPIRRKKTNGTFSTEEYVANWENIYARCWNWENNLPDRRRIDQKRIDMVKDFRAILKSEFEKVKGFDDIGYTDTWTLTDKLGYQPEPVRNAVYFHFNPDSLKEVFCHSVWIGGRKRKYGLLGKLFALVRASMPLSVLTGLVKATSKENFRFVVFKIVYDLGIFAGILGSL